MNIVKICANCGHELGTAYYCSDCVGHDRWTPKAVANDGIMLEDVQEDVIAAPTLDPICTNCVNQTTITCGTCHDHIDFEAIEPVEPDNVNHPQHYTAGGIECIEAIRAALTAEEFRGYCKGNILKYIWRERMKGQDESVKKAIWYAKQMTEVTEK